jgi:hypothetical protein
MMFRDGESQVSGGVRQVPTYALFLAAASQFPCENPTPLAILCPLSPA